MRRITALLLMFAIILLSSCSTNPKDNASFTTFYYVANEPVYDPGSSALVPVHENLREHADDYSALINIYLRGPTTYDCISPFPGGTTLENLQVDNNRATITLSPHFATLTNADLLIACACMTRTLLEMTGVNTVQIKVENGFLNGEESMTFTLGSFVYNDSLIIKDSDN